MTDREEREKVIEILQKEKKTALHDNRWAFDYAIASIKTDLKYDLLYEGVDCNNCKNNLHRGDGSTYCATGDGICHYECEEPTTKNDLVVDLISKEQTIDRVLTYFNHIDKGNDDEWAKGYEAGEEDAIAVIESMPSVTPQEPKSGHWIDNMDLGYHVSICSNCNWRGHGDIDLIYKPKYCPNCGVKMVDLQESEDKEQTDDKDNN